ncbi:hypothetical protein [Candidatus Protofrankia californiensis]|uniref:hypothetical protein n=1 Tax=Candidatus Protofrankia californiensis TaxID=1839754 RepID=UPI001041B171|nr:hypothetical protein [Candidatus Protofrankia californiensis]
MALHKLPEGRSVIDGLSALGNSLGYTVKAEHPIDSDGAAVDVAWFAADYSDVALMIFEVESSASAGMANNVLKVLGQDVDELPKPLFFFHLLLGGGDDNKRIDRLRRNWGTYNYRVYRLNTPGSSDDLVADVLAQHRRIRRNLSVGAIREALSRKPWARVSLPDIFARVERLEFRCNYLREYATLALREAELRSIYLNRLTKIESAGTFEDEGYGTFVGDAVSGLMEICLRVAAGEVGDEQGAAMLERWQESSRLSLRTLGPYMDLSRDYDQLMLGAIPLVYAIAGLVAADSPRSLEWLIGDLKSIMCGEQDHGVHWEYLVPTALWLAHLAAAALARHQESWEPLTRTSMSAFDEARRIINSQGGVPVDVFNAPPSYVYLEEPDTWLERLAGRRSKIDTLDALLNRCRKPVKLERINNRILVVPSTDDFSLALTCLLTDDWLDWDTESITSRLHGVSRERT